MSFGSVELLLVFLPLAWALHWLLPRRATAQNLVLLAVSYVFYATWTPRLVLVLALTTAVNLGAVRLMDRSRGNPTRLRLVFGAAVAYDVVQLLGFKYVGFFATSLNALLMGLGLDTQLPVLHFVLPLGISFWTLQHIGYLIDVFFDRPDDRPTALEFAVFAAFFPQVVSGPIPRGGELLPQFARPRRLSAQVIADASAAFLVGYVLKFFVADTMASYLVDPVFSAPGDYSAVALSAGVVGYAAQVFGDFAGYSAMAIGIGRLFAVELPMNFNYPFFSTDLMEYWRRWHITLNRWLFDYLYGPLVTSHGWFRNRLDLGFILVFSLSGLWHGTTWNFVLWGALHGLGLMAHRRWDVFYRGLCRRDREWVKRRRAGGYLLAAWLVTQGFFLFTLVPFRAQDVATTGAYLAGLTSLAGLHHPFTGNPIGALATAVALGLLVAYHVVEVKRFQVIRERFLAAPAPVRGILYGLLLVVLAILMPVGSGAFIYAQF